MKKFFGKSSSKTNSFFKKIASVRFIVILAIIIGLLAVGLWQYRNATNTDKIFWGAVNNNLQSSSFSKHSTTQSGGQSADQVTEVYLSPKQAIYSRTHFVQTGSDEAEATTENIGTPYADYVRYTDIKTTQKSATGKEFDFSKIINVWGSTTPDKSQTNGQQFGQSLLAAIPAGNLTAAQRRELVKILKEKNVYSYSVSKTSHEGTLARPSYTYTVTLTPSAYVEALKKFGDYVGLTQLKDLNPADYKKANKTQFRVTVDAWSHQIINMVEPGASKEEAVSGYNLRKAPPEVPTKTIGIDELQSRLQSIE